MLTNPNCICHQDGGRRAKKPAAEVVIVDLTEPTEPPAVQAVCPWMTHADGCECDGHIRMSESRSLTKVEGETLVAVTLKQWRQPS
jgi:hypothetical protein